MTLDQVMKELESLGSEQTKKVLSRHGAREPFFGVKVQDLKVLQKKIKHNHELALELYNTGNSDAMYFAGLISEPAKMSKADLQYWAENAPWYMISEYTVAWVASESKFGFEMAREWIQSDLEHIASAGWATWSALVSIKPDAELDVKELKSLLDEIAANIHQAPNRVRYTMNGFVIGAGSYVPALLGKSKEVARKIGKVSVHMGSTACKVPSAPEYIEKVESMNRVGKKRKTAFC
ncbi:MAG: DNA alkylation repair protein [Saprospiraceae bacterium]|nr:DNA alkylation repair protein [Saprospiraceae bacterium]